MSYFQCWKGGKIQKLSSRSILSDKFNISLNGPFSNQSYNTYIVLGCLLTKWLSKVFIILTLLMLKAEYCVIIRSIPWLLIPWLLVLPGHQQPWCWICGIDWSLPSMGKKFHCMWCDISVLRNEKMKYQWLSARLLSSANALEILQFCTTPLIYFYIASNKFSMQSVEH